LFEKRGINWDCRGKRSATPLFASEPAIGTFHSPESAVAAGALPLPSPKGHSFCEIAGAFACYRMENISSSKLIGATAGPLDCGTAPCPYRAASDSLNPNVIPTMLTKARQMTITRTLKNLRAEELIFMPHSSHPPGVGVNRKNISSH
jgi:hypothetical protein